MTDKPKRPRDANRLAAHIVGVATGEIEEVEKPAGQVKGGKKGGKRRADVLTPEQRSEIGRVAAEARWKKGD